MYGKCCACLCVVLADITTCVCTVTTFHHAQVAPHAVICKVCCAQELLQAGAHAGVPQTVPHSGFGTRPSVCGTYGGVVPFLRCRWSRQTWPEFVHTS